MINFATIFKSITKGSLKDILGGAGLTLATSGAVLVALSGMVTAFRTSLSNMPIDILNLAGMIGLDVYFSLIIGAIVSRNVQNAGVLVLKKK